MSRIDIHVAEQGSGRLIANRGFCRSSHLSFFCEGSDEPRVRQFASEVGASVDITNDNIEGFLQRVRHVIGYLETVPESAYGTMFSFFTEEAFTQFLGDLKSSLEFLDTLYKERGLRGIEVEIL